MDDLPDIKKLEKRILLYKGLALLLFAFTLGHLAGPAYQLYSFFTRLGAKFLF